MKKVLSLLFFILLATGCGFPTALNNTPQKQGEMLLAKYQSLDTDVQDDLNRAVAEEVSFNTAQRERYKTLMEKQYKQLTYSVKETTEDGDTATITTEIEVYDFYKVLADADAYLAAHPTEFQDANDAYDASKFMDYRLDQLESNKERVKYTLELLATKTDGEWQMDSLTSTDEAKINGVYVY
jgi:hypothetical protein